MQKKRNDALVEQAEQASRGLINVTKKMCLRTAPGEPKLEWDLKAGSMVEMVTKGRTLCKENGKRWPQDVTVWD